MQNWKLTLAYDGSAYHGWQVQPALRTVQGTLAAALKLLTGETVLPQGSGRTDSGVHALGQVCSFPLAAPIPPQNLKRALNRALPPAIRVLAANHAAADFHARYGAVRKTYEYRILRPGDGVCSPFVAPYVWDCPWDVTLGPMQQAAAAVCGEHDFTSFAAVDPDLTARLAEEPKSAVRTILSSEWTQQGEAFTYRVTGTGFLHHMVRNLVGTFVDVGCGRLRASDIPQILAERNRSASGPTAPARGLFLVGVDYR